MLPLTSFSGMDIPSFDNNSAELKMPAKNETRDQMIEQEFFLYLQAANTNPSVNLKYTQNGTSGKMNRINFTGNVSNKSPAWCNQHFVY